jgi:uncharacterized protein YndB with AHSA1/START domain
MTERSVQHGTFTIERRYDATPEQVFHAFANERVKEAWFAGPDQWTLMERDMEFMPGGRERLKGKLPNGTITIFDAEYFDIIENERIVYAYEMTINGKKISVSLATIQLKPAGKGTLLTVTEQGAFLDGHDDAGSREKGTGSLLDRLGEMLKAE